MSEVESYFPFGSYRIADPFSHSLIFEHPSGGRLYQSGVLGVPEDPAEIGVSLIVTASKKYRRQEKHTNVVFACFRDETNMRDWVWRQIEDMVVPAVQKMVETLESGEGVLSVCRAGLNRSSLLTALAIRVMTNIPPEAVIELIRTQRGTDCLHNPDFRKVIIYGF